MASGDITPAVLAEELGWSRFKAYRKMCEIEAAYPGVVDRQRPGNRLVAERHRIAPHIRGLKETPTDREVRLLRTRLAELEDRFDAEANARIQFQSIAHKWFERVRALESANARKQSG